MNNFNDAYFELLKKIQLECDMGGTTVAVFSTPDVQNGANLLGGTTYAPNDSRNPFNKKRKKKIKKRI